MSKSRIFVKRSMIVSFEGKVEMEGENELSPYSVKVAFVAR